MSDTEQQNSTPLSFRCPLPLYRRMEQHAAALHMDISAFIFTALHHALGSPEELDNALAALNQPHHP